MLSVQDSGRELPSAPAVRSGAFGPSASELPFVDVATHEGTSSTVTGLEVSSMTGARPGLDRAKPTVTPNRFGGGAEFPKTMTRETSPLYQISSGRLLSVSLPCQTQPAISNRSDHEDDGGVLGKDGTAPLKVS